MRPYRLPALLLAALLFVMLLPACAKKGPEDSGEAAQLPTLIWYTVGPAPVDFQAGLDNINRYLEENLGLRLDMRMLPWRELMDTTQQVVNEQEPFDIMFVDSENYNKFVALGAFQDITDTLRTTTPDLWEYIPGLVWSGSKIGGRIYAVPTYKDVAQTQYWVFDKELADACGIKVGEIEDWDDLDAALARIKAVKGEDFYPLRLTRNETFGNIFCGFDSFCSGLPVMGVRVDDPQQKVVCVLEDPMFLERLRKLRKWYLEGIINPDANVSLTYDGSRPFFSAVGWPGAELLWQRNKSGGGTYVSKVIYGPVLSTETIQGSMNAISSQSEHPAEALRLLERINLDPVLRDMLAYGVEGTHFVYESEQVVRQLNNNWNVEIFAQGTFFTMSTTTEQPVNQWDLVKQQNDRATNSVLLGFSMNIGELSTEVAGCRAVWDKYSGDLLTGAADLDTVIPQCLQELRKAGMDILISEAQKQINHYDWGG